MDKISDTGGQVVYRRGNLFGLLFVLLVPAGITAKVWLEADWLPVLIVSGMGLIMLFVSGTREQVVFDTLARTVTCTESFFGRQLRSELIAFGRITRLVVGPCFERGKNGRGPAYQAGFHLTVEWNAEWGGGAQRLGAFHEEEAALREAGELARRIGTDVERAASGRRPAVAGKAAN
jgi:hypothetical protein